MESRNLQLRSLCVAFFLVLLFSALSVRLVYVQGVDGGRYEKLASKQFVQRQVLYAYRGSILDRNGDPLAGNKPSRTVFVDMNHLRNFRNATRGLTYAEGRSREELFRKYDEEEIRSRYLSLVAKTLWRPLGYVGEGDLFSKLSDPKGIEIVLRKRVDEDMARDLQVLLKERDIRGVYFRSHMERQYPSESLASHLIGFVNHEGVGQEGVERSLNEYLAGEPGYRYIERDSAGREIQARRGEMKEPIHGGNVSLTIDMRIQTIVERELDKAIAKYGPGKASIVVMDPYTGEILALTSRPTYNPNSLDDDASKRRNSTVSQIYDPGSVFKIVAVSKALDLGLVNLNTVIDTGNGVYWESTSRGKRWSLTDHRPLGPLNVRDIIAKSSNIGTYKLAKQLGPRRFYEHIEAFGFGKKTGVGMAGESAGILRHYTKWWGSQDMSRIGMGYSISVTPLQMLTAMCAVANGGELVRPRIIDSISDHSGHIVSEGRRHVVRRVIRERTAKDVCLALVKVVGPKGTAPKAAVEGYAVAGKTGTAQMLMPSGQYSSKHLVTSFAGFLPAEDPKFACIVVLHDPQFPGMKMGGGSVAAPIFADIARQCMPVLGVEPAFIPTSTSDTDTETASNSVLR